MAARSEGESAPVAPSSARVLGALFFSARPAQWVKNLVLPLPFLFGGALGNARGWRLATTGFVILCAVTSAIYCPSERRDGP